MSPKKDILKNFGEQIRKFRKAKGISQEQLGFDADLHRTYIGMIERGEKNITLINISKLAKALGRNCCYEISRQDKTEWDSNRKQ